MKVDFEKEKVKEYKYQVHQEVMVVDGLRYRRTYSTYDDREGWSIFDIKKRTFEPISVELHIEHYNNDFNLERIFQKAKGNPLYED